MELPPNDINQKVVNGKRNKWFLYHFFYLYRIDRNKGYTKDNVVLCCYSANIGRNENDEDTWKKFLSILQISLNN
jgi:hypothetical protein